MELPQKRFSIPCTRFRFKISLLCVMFLLFLGCSSMPPSRPYTAPAGAIAKSGRPIVSLSATQLAAAIRSGSVTSEQAVRAYLDQIHKYNPKLNAIVTIDEAAAIKRARAADAALARGELWGPLHGVPITVKDHFAVKGMRTTNGYPPLANQVTDYDATVVKRLKDAGAIILGKTNMPVLAMDMQTFNPIFGRTNNPWDLTRTPGGSTGGGAAAVASGMTALSVGSDMGGSIRIPADFCGVFGFKPTAGSVSEYGSFPGVADIKHRTVRHMVSIGPLARSIADLKLCFSIIAGPDPHDPLVPAVDRCPPPVKNYPDLKIAWSDNFGNVPISADTRRVLTTFVGKLAHAGCHIEKQNPAHFNFTTVWETWGKMNDLQIGVNIPSSIRLIIYLFGWHERGKSPMLQMVFPATYEKYITVESRREMLAASFDRFMENYDVFICPVATRSAFHHHPPSSVKFGFALYDEPIRVDNHEINYWMAAGAYTSVFNVTGNPVVTIPAGFAADGMPIDLQIVGHRGADMELLDIAKKINMVAGRYRTPPGY